MDSASLVSMSRKKGEGGMRVQKHLVVYSDLLYIFLFMKRHSCDQPIINPKSFGVIGEDKVQSGSPSWFI